MTVLDYAAIQIAAGLAASGQYKQCAPIAEDAVDIALEVFRAINEEGF